MNWKPFACFIPIFFLSLFPVSSCAQEIRKADSIRIDIPKENIRFRHGNSSLGKVSDIKMASAIADTSSARLTFKLQDVYFPIFPVEKSPLHEGEYSVSGLIRNYSSGHLYGMGRQANIIGMGPMNYAGIGYIHTPGHWLFDFQVYALKWSVPRRESLLLGLSGLMTYPVSGKLSLNAFASYSHLLSSPFGTISYGGFISYDWTPNWGVDVGVRSLIDCPSGKMESLPVFTPYFRHKNSKFGIDIGSGLFHLFTK